MQTKGIIPNEVTSLTTLDVCGSLQAEPKGKHVHARILCTTFGKDLNICNAVFNMYGRCRNVQGAQRIFLSITRDLVSWNAMLAIYAQNGYGRAALELLKHLQSEGIRPDKFTWTEVFNACANLGGLAESKRMHACFMSLETECDATVHSALIHMYGKCGNMDEAHKIFVTMHCQQLIAWNIMIAACAFNGSVREALHVFQLLQIEDMMPDNVTYLTILEGIALLAFAKRLHAYVLKSSFHWDIAVATSIVNTYGRCGSPDDAERMFGNISNKNIVSWNTMLNAYAQNGKGREAIQVFQEMQLRDLTPDTVTYVTMFDVVTSLSALFEGKRLHACILRSESKMDLIVSNTLINMYAKCGSLVDACSTFNKLVECDLVTWNAMIVAYAQRDYLSMESIQLFEEMQQDGVMPDKITLSSVLDACANVSALDKGKKTHQIIVMCGHEADVVIGNSLLNMYTKCGRLDSAQMVFENMVERDVVSWTAMMAGYAQYGHGREALQLFKQMLLGGGISDQVTIITILSACGHGGLVNEGLYLFMISCNTDVILTTEHYGCVVDLLGRAKFLDEAQDFVHSMPVEPVAKTWATLLGACQVETDIERALYAAKNAFDLDRTNPAPYILLSNICAASTTLDVSEDMRKLLKEWQQEEG